MAASSKQPSYEKVRHEHVNFAKANLSASAPGIVPWENIFGECETLLRTLRIICHTPNASKTGKRDFYGWMNLTTEFLLGSACLLSFKLVGRQIVEFGTNGTKTTWKDLGTAAEETVSNLKTLGWDMLVKKSPNSSAHDVGTIVTGVTSSINGLAVDLGRDAAMQIHANSTVFLHNMFTLTPAFAGAELLLAAGIWRRNDIKKVIQPVGNVVNSRLVHPVHDQIHMHVVGPVRHKIAGWLKNHFTPRERSPK